MLNWLARRLSHRLTQEELLLLLEPVPAEVITVDAAVEMLAKREDFKGFLAWRRSEANGEETWGWAANGIGSREIVFQLERAAEQVLAAMPAGKGDER